VLLLSGAFHYRQQDGAALATSFPLASVPVQVGHLKDISQSQERAVQIQAQSTAGIAPVPPLAWFSMMARYCTKRRYTGLIQAILY
jgi:hypothetical protein